MSRIPALALVAVLGVAAPALAATAPAKPAPAKAAPAAAVPTWVVNKAQSKIGFKSTFTGAPIEGSFKTWDAQIAFDPKNLAASKVQVTIDVASVTSTDDEASEALPTADWLNAKANPRATFTSNSFKDLGGGKYQAAGTLNLRGVSQPVVLNFTLAIQGNVARVNGTTQIDRSKFGVGQGQFKGPESIPLGVGVTVAVVAQKK